MGGGGLYSSALAEFVARAFNRYTGLAAFAPALVAMEEGTLRWLAGEMGLPGGAGIVSTGGSLATLTALVAARVDRLGDDIGTGTVYVTEYTHRCVAKAAWVAGLRPDQVRVVRSGPDLRMDPAAAAGMIEADRSAGRRPFLLVGTAGTTHTGTVDPLGDLAAVARRRACGSTSTAPTAGCSGTARGRARLAGIEEAASVVLDPHKSLFLPHGTGVALVRDGATLRRAFAADGHYLQDVAGDEALPDYADLGPELTRDPGLRLWLPLHLHGVAAFRDALDEKLDLAAYAHGELARSGGLELPWAPDLSIVAFRLPGGEAANGASQALLARVNAGRRVHISSTRVGGVVTLRLCIISHRTHHDRVAEAVEVIVREAAAVPGREQPVEQVGARAGERARAPAGRR